MKQIWITKVGAPETLQVREAPDPEPRAGEIRIRVKASGINFADIMARLGLYQDAPKIPCVVGYEVSGIVDKVGDEIRHVRPGDKVIGLCRFGGYSDAVVLKPAQVFPLPENFSFAQGAALPVNYLTVYQMLVAMGGIKSGDRVAVHSAAGGIGFAAIDICRIYGARVVGIASSGKHDVLRQRGVTELIDSRAQDFEKEIAKITNGRGVEFVLDPVGGESWAKSFRSLAPTGRLVVFGFSAAAPTKRRDYLSLAKALVKVPWFRFNPLTLMNENKGVLGVNLGHLWDEPEMVRNWGDQLLEWARAGKISPTVDKEFPFEQAAQAHHYIQDRKNVGKVVLTTD